MKFFSLTKEGDNLLVEEGKTLVTLNNNPILDEYAAFYDLQQDLFNQSI